MERFWSKVSGTDALGCWLWTGSLTIDGYPQLKVGPSLTGAHRYAYELLVAEIPTGLEIDHLCRVRNCVNPWHMEPVTHLENVQRAIAARMGVPLEFVRTRAQRKRACRGRPRGPRIRLSTRDFCNRGHDLQQHGLYVRPRDGAEMCRACRREDQYLFLQRRYSRT